MLLSLRLLGILAASTLTVSAAVANGMCPYDDQGPLGCPEGTVWHAKLEVCLSASKLVG